MATQLKARRMVSIILLLFAFAAATAQQPKRASVRSHVTIITPDGKTKKVIYAANRLFEAPNWSPDGKYLILNSEGKLWRLPVRGGEPELIPTGSVDGINNDHGISADEWEDWFPHPSPDGQWLVFLSFQKGTKGHPPNQNVVLRIMPLPGTKSKKEKIREVTRLFSGQGTINVASWSPDSKHFAYVSYTMID